MEDQIKEALSITNAMMEFMVKDKTTFKNMAKMMRAYYEELMGIGFTDQEAIRIISNYKVTSQ